MNLEEINKIRSFNRFYTNVLGLLDKHLLDSEYTLTEVRIMYEIYNSNEITAKELTTTLKFDKGYLSRVLKKLSNLKLIVKNVSDKDKRHSYLKLSKTGILEFEKLNSASNSQVLSIIENIEKEKVNALINHMISIEKILTGK